MPPDGTQYNDSGVSGNREQSAILSAEDIKRCREINLGNRELIMDIVRIVSKHTGIPVAYLKGKRRKRNLSQARWMIFYLAHVKQKFTLQEIGNVLGVDHTSVLHGVQQERIRRGEA
jgi:chromosomal replication initiation ATPase DnaA